MEDGKTNRGAAPEDAEAAELAKAGKAPDGKKPGARSARRKAGVAIGCCAVAAALVAGGTAIAKQSAPSPQSEDSPAAVQSASAAPSESGGIDVTSTAEGWDEATSTPLIVHVEGTATADTEGTAAGQGQPSQLAASDQRVDRWYAVPADGTFHADVPQGTYTVEAVAPVNADGSIYGQPGTVEASVGPESAEVAVPLEHVPADQATKEQVDEAVAKVRQAADEAKKADPDGSLAKAADDVASKAAENAAQSPAEQDAGASADDIADAAEEAASAAEENGGASQAEPSQADQGASGSEGDSGTAAAEPSGGTDGGAADAGSDEGSAPSDTGSSYETPQPTWHSNIVTVVDQPAYDETTYERVTVYHCQTCGAEFTDPSEVWTHGYQHALNDEPGDVSTYVKSIPTGTVHHDAITHTEDQGWWE